MIYSINKKKMKNNLNNTVNLKNNLINLHYIKYILNMQTTKSKPKTNEELFGGAKTTRGKKKSIADQFGDLVVTTTTTTQKKVPSKKKPAEEEEQFKKNGYTRPEVTYTDQLSKEQIEEKLEDYKKVDDIFKVPLGVHMRYFANVGGKRVFRMGGQLYKNTGLPDYVILNSGTAQWSVQVKDTIFYRKMTLQEIKTEYQTIIDELIEKNKKLKDENKKLNAQLDKYAK